jgi:hypothetical protein
MPLYSFLNEETGEIKDVFMPMNSEHEYADEKGKSWTRIWTVPQAVIDGKISCWSERQFVEKTGKSKDSLGSIWDRSKELSEKRASESSDGIDPLRKKGEEQYSKERKGRPFIDNNPNKTFKI